MYEFMNWLDLNHGFIEGFGTILLGVSIFMVNVILWWPDKTFMDKWSETAKRNLAEGIRKHG